MNTKQISVSMRRIAGAAAAVLLAVGVLATSDASAQIAGTKHNLGTGRVSGVTMDGTRTNEFSGTAEICVFCHTPHGSDTSAAVPLWNRTMAAPTSYTTYNSLGTSSLDGATAPVGSVSLACLSCHDGTQAMNTVINQPGSGLTNTSYAGSWSGDRHTAGAVNGIANLGKDLRNDHPIGIQYAGGPNASGIPAAGSVYPRNNFRDNDFQPAQSASLNGMAVWWVDTGASGTGTREKTDMLLYSRSDSASVNRDGSTGSTLTGAQPFVECASCHDPHTSQTTFLRISNAASAVCLACHIK